VALHCEVKGVLAPANQEKFGRVTRFRSDSELRAAITKSVDPFCASDYFQFRSLLSCRSAFFGYDGQAFLCLHVEDDPPTSPAPSLFFVEERSDFLTSYDYFDGVALVDESPELGIAGKAFGKRLGLA
jgi:hypothetical protein